MPTRTWTDLPAHVWALVLRDATLSDLFRVAHVCRALHALVTSRDACACARGLLCDEQNSRTHAFWTHLHDARTAAPTIDEWRTLVDRGYVAHVALALHLGMDPNADDQSAIWRAIQRGHLPIVHLVLNDERVDPSVHYQEVIRMASCAGHVDVVERLLRDDRVDPSPDDQYALRWASANGHVAVVKVLLGDKRVDPSAGCNYAIRWASYHGHAEIVEMLLRDKRVDPSDENQFAIGWARANRHQAVVNCLLRDERVDPSTGDRELHGGFIREDYGEMVDLCLNDRRTTFSPHTVLACYNAARHYGHELTARRLISLHMEMVQGMHASV